MHESELVNCEKTPSERGLERAAERERTHTLTHTLIWISFETILWVLRGDTGKLTRVRERDAMPDTRKKRDAERVTTVEVAFV